MPRYLITILVISVLCACSAKEANLVQLRSNDTGPEEFSIDVKKALQEPADYAALPKPGGASNRADLTPRRDAIALLGGAEGASVSAENALLTYVVRYGVDPDIRTVLAEEDSKKRRNAARMRRFQFFEPDKYAKHYSSFSLNAEAEAQFWRKRGVQVPRPIAQDTAQ